MAHNILWYRSCPSFHLCLIFPDILNTSRLPVFQATPFWFPLSDSGWRTDDSPHAGKKKKHHVKEKCIKGRLKANLGGLELLNSPDHRRNYQLPEGFAAPRRVDGQSGRGAASVAVWERARSACVRRVSACQLRGAEKIHRRNICSHRHFR